MEHRKASMQDIPAMIAIRKQQLIDEGITPSVSIDRELDGFFRRMLDKDELVQWLLEDDGKIAATSAVCFYGYPPSFTNPTGLIAYITNMYTHPDYRRRGIGRRMLHLAVSEAAARGARVVRLGASALGRPLYEKYGFRQETQWLSLRLPENRDCTPENFLEPEAE